MMARDELRIRTPEGVEFALPLAGPFTRMLAYAIDLIVIAMLGGAAQSAAAALGVFGRDLVQALSAIVYFVISIAYGMTSEWVWRGQTVGKRLLGLRVVDARGLRLEPSQVIVRNLLRFVDLLPAFYLVGGVACVWSRRRQRLGDLAAGTVVIRTPRLARPDIDQLLGGKYNTLAESRHLAARLRQKTSPEVAALALEAVIRRDVLEPPARLVLFAELAAHLRSLADYPPENVEQLSDEQYVRSALEVVYRSESRGVSRKIQ